MRYIMAFAIGLPLYGAVGSLVGGALRRLRRRYPDACDVEGTEVDPDPILLPDLSSCHVEDFTA